MYPSAQFQIPGRYDYLMDNAARSMASRTNQRTCNDHSQHIDAVGAQLVDQ